ncbi:MAG: InlB B-repeat-containing protein, partial [Clostridia bacterium]|nr:InlB B-repeat-containing protein [Clostridia bacterium]
CARLGFSPCNLGITLCIACTRSENRSSQHNSNTYVAAVEPGTYFPWHKENGTYHKARSYELVIEHANAELHLHHYTVKYDTNGGVFKAGEEVGTEIYPARDAVNATSNVPVREGFIFTGWDYDGKAIDSGKQVTASITAPVVLKAKWEKAVNVTINVTIDHKTENGFDPNPTRTDLDVDFVEMKAGTDAFVETGDKLHFRKEKTTDEKGNEKAYNYSIENNVSTYKATDFTYTGLLESSTFGVALSKSGYDVGTIEKKQDKMGNWTINIPLTYNPDDFDIDFSIEMADDVPKELYPDAVIVKIAYWNTETKEWKIISQQENNGAVVKPGVRVDIDPVTGEGSGSYPVWKYDGNKEPYGYREVVTGFIYKDSTIVVPTEKDHTKDDNTVIVTYTDGNYTATMGDIADGKKFSTSLNGAYYDKDTDGQQGTLHGVITVEKYDVTFDANGGTIKGGNTYTETDEYYVPDTKNYVPSFDGHEFGGWYKDPEFKEPVTDGEILKENVTFYAKWDQILTGNVRVAGSYMQDGNIVDVWAVDRANSAVVVLEEITQDGEYIVDSQTVNIVWPMSEMIYGISEEYKFTG